MHPAVQQRANAFADQQAFLLDLVTRVQQIPAPTFAEAERADWVAAQLRDLQIGAVQTDELPNVYLRVPGQRADAPALLISAHTDTVFPAETDLTLRRDEASGRVFGPGIGDNSTGVGALLALAHALGELPPPPVDLWLVANVGEEGLGDLRGMRAAVEFVQNATGDQLGACIVLEGTGLGRVVHRALGSKRLRVAVSAPGGHSWSDFGTPSAIHVLTQIAAEISGLRVPEQPRTAYNVGRIEGGTSINTIAQNATFELDMRSQDAGELDKLVQQVRAIIHRHRAAAPRVTIAVEQIGDRPMGSIAADHPLVRAAKQTLRAADVELLSRVSMSSTDANIPLSLGIPAVCIGITEGGNAHRLEEWIHPARLPQGMQHLLALTWWAAAWLAGEEE